MADLQANDIMITNVVTVQSDITIGELSNILLKNKVSGVPVVDKEDKLIGIVTEADIIKDNIKIKFPFYFDPLMVSVYMVDFEKYNENVKDYLNTKVEEIMNQRVKTANPQTPVNEIADIMVNSKVNRVPIIDENKKVVGIVTRADIVKSMI
ncbi:CBS domain-containing protein [bacterium]|nr:CBS domain-containing protein [bacterium]